VCVYLCVCVCVRVCVRERECVSVACVHGLSLPPPVSLTLSAGLRMQVVKRLGQVVTDSNDRPKDEVKIYKSGVSTLIQ